MKHSHTYITHYTCSYRYCCVCSMHNWIYTKHNRDSVVTALISSTIETCIHLKYLEYTYSIAPNTFLCVCTNTTACAIYWTLSTSACNSNTPLYIWWNCIYQSASICYTLAILHHIWMIECARKLNATSTSTSTSAWVCALYNCRATARQPLVFLILYLCISWMCFGIQCKIYMKGSNRNGE